MSISLMTAAWETRLPLVDKFVFIALCDNASDEGICIPSIKSMSAKCSLTEKDFLTAVTRLVAAGVISIGEEPGIGEVYTIELEWAYL